MDYSNMREVRSGVRALDLISYDQPYYHVCMSELFSFQKACRSRHRSQLINYSISKYVQEFLGGKVVTKTDKKYVIQRKKCKSLHSVTDWLILVSCGVDIGCFGNRYIKQSIPYLVEDI